MGKAKLPFISVERELTAEDASDYPLGQSATPHRLHFWPTTPVPLAADPIVEHSLDIFDIVLCLIPLVLIAKVCLCILAFYIDRSNQGDYIDQVSFLTLYLIQFNGQLTTLFTIVFISIMTITVRRLALWKAQQGATVAELELYQSSISLPATLRVIFTLRIFTWTTAALIGVWSFYYLGSQASSREYSYRDSGAYTGLQVAYLSSTAKSPFADGSFANMSVIQRTDMTAKFHIYSATDPSSKGYDLAGAVLVPVYELSSDSSVVQDLSDWRDVSIASSNHYSSSIGQNLYYQAPAPLLSGTSPGNRFATAKLVGDFTFNTSYLDTNCTAPILVHNASQPVGLLPAMTMSLNMTADNTPNNSADARSFRIWGSVDSNYSVQAICNITEHFVEVETRCDANGCKARKMRLDSTRGPISNQTPFDNPEFASTFFSEILLACGVPPSASETMDIVVEQDSGWTALRTDLVSALQASGDVDPSASPDVVNALSQLSATNLSLSMTKLMNTYYTASQFLPYQHSFEQSLRQNSSVLILPNDTSFAHVTMNGAPYYPQYAISVPWIVMDLLSCQILLMAAIAAFWLRKRTLAPDILGYVSSLTRENPRMALPDGGSTLSGLDRARAMKNVKVKIGDVRGPGGVRRVGLSYVGNEELGMTELDHRRWYM